MNKKKIALGVVVVVLFWAIGNELINVFELPISPTTQSVVVSLFGTGLGAFVAKRNFLLPALTVWLLCWSFALYILYQISVPTGHASVLELLQYNWISISLSALATLIGVFIGQSVARPSQEVRAAT